MGKNAYANSKGSSEPVTVSPEPMLFSHMSGRSRGNFSQRTRYVVLLRGWAWTLKDWFLWKVWKMLFSWLGSFENSLTEFAYSVEILVKLIAPDKAHLCGSVGCASSWWSGGWGFGPLWSATFFPGVLIMKYILWSFSPFCWFEKGSCQFAKKCSQYWLTA